MGRTGILLANCTFALLFYAARPATGQVLGPGIWSNRLLAGLRFHQLEITDNTCVNLWIAGESTSELSLGTCDLVLVGVPPQTVSCSVLFRPSELFS
ncbi:hypothetical protein B0H12DRAFT_47388 [Mycena haematopus]|nr:hypothetical protein B0H12DRAFT_47388 [Mycena haematopus]